MPRQRAYSIRRASRTNNASASSYTRRSLNVGRKPTNLQRALTAFRKMIQEGEEENGFIKVARLIEVVTEQANENGETLGKRTEQCIHTALSTLRSNGYVSIVLRGEDKYVSAKPQLTKIMEPIEAELLNYCHLSKIEQHRAACDYFGSRLLPKHRRASTNRELEDHNLRLKQEQEDHRRICPLQSDSETGEAVDETMDVDEVTSGQNQGQAAGQATPQTPVRRSVSVNNSAAYPTPDSGPRQTFSLNMSLPHLPETPTRGSSPVTPGPLAGSSENMDIDRENPFSREAPSDGEGPTGQNGGQAAGTATPQTPVRRSGTLNNPAAYPSPLSAPRRTLPPRTSLPPLPQSPTRGSSHAMPEPQPGSSQNGNYMDVDEAAPGGEAGPPPDCGDEPCRIFREGQAREISTLEMLVTALQSSKKKIQKMYFMSALEAMMS